MISVGWKWHHSFASAAVLLGLIAAITFGVKACDETKRVCIESGGSYVNSSCVVPPAPRECE